MRRQIGFFGGTFDPVHNGHLRLALEAKQLLGLDEMRLLPCHRPPHREAPQANSQQRADMLRLAIAQCPALQLDERELRRDHVSYTIDTLREVRAELGAEVSVVWVLGMDAFIGLNTWRSWEDLLTFTHLVVAQRPGCPQPTEGEMADYLQRKQTDSNFLQQQPCGGIVLPSLSLLPISSSKVREQIHRGESPQFLLPDAVWQYIHQHRLYR